jgi:4-amino-4-deoxy-L-arabinose transferase-like glycosyltransferase/Tfp pilus assembly protein PilF
MTKKRHKKGATDPKLLSAMAEKAHPPRRAGYRKLALWMIAVAAIAFAVRFAYIMEVREHPLVTEATGDPRAYDERALEIAKGQWLDDDVFFHSSPAYPYVLALIYRVFGHSYFAVRIIQSLVGVGTCILLFLIARDTFGPRQGVIAGILAALYAPFIFFDSELLMITFVIFFAMLALRLLQLHEAQHRRWMVILAGLSLGVAALGKPNALLFLPAAMIWLWWISAEPDRPRRTALAPVLLLLGVAAMIAPVTISNTIVADDFVLTSSNFGINFFIGQTPEANGTFLVDQSMRTDLYAGSKYYAENALGRKLKPSEVSDYWFSRGMRYVKEDPGRALRLIGRKFLLFWNCYEIPNHYNFNFFRTFSNVLRFNPVLFSWVIPVGFLGLYVSRHLWRKNLIFYLFVVAYLLSLMPFFITSRYRLPVVPVMIVFAAHGLYWLWDHVRKRETRGLARPAAVLIVAAVIVNIPIVSFSFAHQYSILGGIYRDYGIYDQRNYDEAIKYYRLAAEQKPGFDLPYLNLGSVLIRLGRFREAEEALRTALFINPELAAAYSNLGIIYIERKMYAEAKTELIKATRRDPNLPEAWGNLARVSIITEDFALARDALEEVLRLTPDDANAHWNLAIILAEDGETQTAIGHARRAARLDPSLQERVDSFIATAPAQ